MTTSTAEPSLIATNRKRKWDDFLPSIPNIKLPHFTETDCVETAPEQETKKPIRKSRKKILELEALYQTRLANRFEEVRVQILARWMQHISQHVSHWNSTLLSANAFTMDLLWRDRMMSSSSGMATPCQHQQLLPPAPSFGDVSGWCALLEDSLFRKHCEDSVDGSFRFNMKAYQHDAQLIDSILQQYPFLCQTCAEPSEWVQRDLENEYMLYQKQHNGGSNAVMTTTTTTATSSCSIIPLYVTLGPLLDQFLLPLSSGHHPQAAGAAQQLFSCKHCKSAGKVIYNTMQTRSADEPETVWYRCQTCNRSWRD